MSTVEERLVQDLAAVTGAVVVTESDLTEARDRVLQRAAVARQRERRHIQVGLAAAVAAIAVLGLVVVRVLGSEDRSAPPVSPGPTAPADPDAGFLAGSAPTPVTVSGLWRVDNGTQLVLFDPDGTMRLDDGGRLYTRPAVTGTYRLGEGEISVTIATGSPECIGQQFSMRASVAAAGEMHVVHAQSASAGCSPARGERWVLQQVLPTYNHQLAGLAVPAQADWQPVTGAKALHGAWMAEVTDPLWPANTGGYVLEIAPDGTYAVAAQNTVTDRGRWSFDATTSRMVLVSGAGSDACREGDRLILRNVEQVDPGTPSMRFATEQNPCGGDWASNAWIRLPDRFS